MGQVLRITFESKDHTFRILNEMPVTRGTDTIDLLLDGQPLKMIRSGKDWVAKSALDGASDGLIHAIARNIALRYRL